MNPIAKLSEDLRYTMIRILAADPINGPVLIYSITQDVLNWAGESDIRRAG
jgi:hypothetical protein